MFGIMQGMGRKKEDKFRAMVTLGPIGARLMILHGFPGRGTLLTAALMLWDQANASVREALIQEARSDFPEPKELLSLFGQMLNVSNGMVREQYRAMLAAIKDDEVTGKAVDIATQPDPPTSRRKPR